MDETVAQIASNKLPKYIASIDKKEVAKSVSAEQGVTEEDMGEEERITIAFSDDKVPPKALDVEPGSVNSTQQETEPSTSTTAEPTFPPINRDLDLPSTSGFWQN
ncbi:hypothetical protein ILUMI_08230 [Ignelater luminosus]|uniref:Uncharacterized protein n=1 Tax=Ignelater luminosus TaxID=2038154 RepID=A0A8K0D6H6_IGNLU|nr:hypothetical protein ILUMI_08230 [Ignelater luminosus]